MTLLQSQNPVSFGSKNCFHNIIDKSGYHKYQINMTINIGQHIAHEAHNFVSWMQYKYGAG